MRRIHGFNAQNIVASWSEPNSDGDFRDIDAPRNAPAKNPVAHLDKVAFHSDFFLYEKLIDQVVTVSHPVIPTGMVSWRPPAPYPSAGATIAGRVTETSHVLLNHGLGYTPIVVVSHLGVMLSCGSIVQTAAAGTRFVSVYADENVVGLGEGAYSSDVALPAVALNYRVVVFSTPEPDPAMYQFSGNADHFQLGRGVIDSEKSYLRRVEPEESDLDMDLGRTVDISNGSSRVITGGNVYTDYHYNGSFTGGGFVPVDV